MSLEKNDLTYTELNIAELVETSMYMIMYPNDVAICHEFLDGLSDNSTRSKQLTERRISLFNNLLIFPRLNSYNHNY